MQMQQMQGMLGQQMMGASGGGGGGALYAGGQGGTMPPFAAGSQPVSTSGLLQQQLAQQAAAMAAQNVNYHAGQQQQNAARPVYANQQPAYAASPGSGYPQQSFAPQQRQPGPPPLPGAFMTPAAYPQSQPQQPVSATPAAATSASSMTSQELQEVLRGVALQGMTHERFGSLLPIQQAALRELMARQRAQQQGQLARGAPPAGPQGTPLRTMPTNQGANGSSAAPNRPAPIPNGTPAPAAPLSGPQLAFLKTLADFYAKRGQPFAGPPNIEGRVVDLARMFAAVQQAGGSAMVSSSQFRHAIATGVPDPEVHRSRRKEDGDTSRPVSASLRPRLNSTPPIALPPSSRLEALYIDGSPGTRSRHVLPQAYQRLLLPFEQFWVQAQRARQAGTAGSPAANAMSPPSNGFPSTPGSAPSPYAAPSPAAVATPKAGPKQTIQARRIERQASEMAQQQNAQAIASHSASSQPALGGAPAAAVASPLPATAPTRAQPAPTTLQAPPQIRPRTGDSSARPPPSSAMAPSQNEAIKDVKSMLFSLSLAIRESVLSRGRFAAEEDPKPIATKRRPSRTEVPTVKPRPDTSRPLDGPPSATAPPTEKVAVPAEPPRRKRRRIAYRPYAKPADTFGGVEHADQVLVSAERIRQSRQLGDLGLVDVHALTMSLRCRVASEVSYALNTLAVVALHMSNDSTGTSATTFPLDKCPDLFEELLDLLEETAFGSQDEPRPQRRDDGVGTSSVVRPSTSQASEPRSYLELFRLIEAEKGDVACTEARATDRRSRDDETTGLAPAAIIVAVMNLLRGLTITERNMRFAAQEPRLARLLFRVSALPLSSGQPGSSGSAARPSRLPSQDLLAVRKVAIELLAHISLDVELDSYPGETTRDAVELVLFFLRDAALHKEPFTFDLCSALPSLERIPQPHAKPAQQSPTVLPYLGFALATSARLFLRDGNRSAVASLLGEDELHDLFVDLVAILPITEKDFQVMTYESGLIYMHSIVVSLYNFTCVASTAIRTRLRRHPKITRAFLRMVRRLAGTQVTRSDDDIYQQIAHRALAILRLLNDGATSARTSRNAAAGPNADLPWFGLSMSGLDEESDDSAGHDGPILPTSSGEDGAETPGVVPAGANDADRRAAPILAGEARHLLEHMSQGMMPLVIPSLIALAGTVGGRSGRKGR